MIYEDYFHRFGPLYSAIRASTCAGIETIIYSFVGIRSVPALQLFDARNGPALIALAVKEKREGRREGEAKGNADDNNC